MKNILRVVRKEWKETLRDRRVLFGAFVMPMVLVAVMMTAFGSLEGFLSKRPESRIGYREAPEGFASALGSGVNAEPFQDAAEAIELVKKGRLSAFAQAGAEGRMEIHFDSSRPMSIAGASLVQQALESLRRKGLRAELENRGADPSLSEPAPVDRIDVAKKQSGGSILVMILPYLVVLWTFYSGMSAAADLVAGEKERGTLETLLSSPLTRTEAAIGKLAALGLLCLAGGLATLAAMLVAGPIALAKSGAQPPSPASIGLLVMLLVPLAALFSSILVAVSSAARTMREAQTYLSFVSLIVLVPAVSSQFVGILGQDQAAWVAWTPILNTAVAIAQALRGQLELGLALKAGLTSLVPAALLAWLAVSLFRREGILSRT
jgi:sodium transport system permease protein